MPPPPRCLLALQLLARCCWQLAVAAVRLPAVLCYDAMLWTAACLAFPVRLLAAIDGERKMDWVVGEMQRQMERLLWQNRQLEERLDEAARERDAMGEILDEMEEEHDAALARIDQLQSQVKALKVEIMRLREHRGKSMWDKGRSAAPGAEETRPATARQRGGDTGEEEEDGCAVVQAKAVARRRSVFSLCMSVAVGAVAWRAEAACLPLLAGLYAVVGMSMCSVARFFRSSAAARRRSSAASDAVALLGINCFLLGVLTYPMLPRAARLAQPWMWLPAIAAPRS